MTKRSLLHSPNRIKQLRMEKGLTQRELAHLMGYQSVSSLSHLEAGHKMGLTQQRYLKYHRI